MKTLRIACLAGLVLAGCGESAAPPDARSETAVPTDAWVGQWNGPEGTFLKIEGAHGAYDVTVRNLDGPRTFKGTADGDGIRFERDGQAVVLRATQGEGTGMKWLADKHDCLAVAPGEGWCRD